MPEDLRPQVNASAFRVFLALAVLGVAACGSSSEEGVGAVVVTDASENAGPWTTNLGYSVTLDEGYLTLSAVELVACRTASRPVPFFGSGVAFAHLTSTTRLGTPFVQSLLSAPKTMLGRIAPPATTYCGVGVAFGAAEGSAHDLPATPNMIGKTLHLRGVATREDESFPFMIETSLLSRVDFEAKLDLTERGDQVTIAISRDPKKLFDGIEFSSLFGDSLTNAVVENVRSSISIRLE